jgi:murein DD-endopeptidase MepM/ murein hydrolase activator NlpD
VLAPQDSTVWKLSGHPPGEYVPGSSVFGWSVYLMTAGGVIYFVTHLGERALTVGQKIKAGQVIGTVGHWPNDPSRSHSHIGVTHPAGRVAATARIVAVSQAPRRKVSGFP